MIKFNSTTSIMLGVTAATIPGIIQASINYGFIILIQVLFCILICLLFEVTCLKFSKQKIIQITNLTWLVTGVLLAISIPLGTTFQLCIAAAFFSIVVIKFGAGGTGKNILNPAMAGLGFLAICFYNQIHPVGEMSPSLTYNLSFKNTLEFFFSFNGFKTLDAIVSATPLGLKTSSTQLTPSLSSLGFAFGGVLLIWQRLIRFEIPFFIVLSYLVVDTMCGNPFNDALIRLSFGGLIFAAFFIATDPVTSPITRYGRTIYATIIGTIVALSRNNGLHPDGIVFGVLAANLMVPHLDRLIWKYVKT